IITLRLSYLMFESPIGAAIVAIRIGRNEDREAHGSPYGDFAAPCCVTPRPFVRRMRCTCPAFDPKRTFLRPTPSRVAVQIATVTCLSLGGDNEAARIHRISWRNGGVAVGGARATVT